MVMIDRAKKIHAEAIVIDSTCPLLDDPKYLDWYVEGGVDVVAPSVASTESARHTIDLIGVWHRLVRERGDLTFVRIAADISRAKTEKKLGIYLHFQGTDPIEDNLDLIDLYKALGVGMIQLTYNGRNRSGDGCEEPSDAGLSRFGQSLVKRLNQARVIVDCSHTGERTALDAVACSSAPVVLSHSNVKRLHPNPRNASDTLIKAVAESGGMVGICGFPGFLSTEDRPTLDCFIDHIGGVAELVGIDHVGLGLDYCLIQAGVASDAAARDGYESAISSGVWSDAYPIPPYYYPQGIETPRTFEALTVRLLERGFTTEDVGKILGGNWIRIAQTVWG